MRKQFLPQMEQMECRLVPSVVNVHAGDDLQAAINHAQPGDQLVLDAGATFGAIRLPNKTGNQWITIQSSALDHLPAPGQRVGPTDAPFMPKITSPGAAEPALQTAAGAHNFRFVGVEFLPATKDAFLYDLITLGDGGNSAQTTLAQVPHDLQLDQCYVHTWLDQSLKRGIALNSAATDIVNSYVAGFKVNGQDAQAIAGWNGPGPFKINNNYIEGAGENVIFGGAPAAIPNLIPSDIEIRGNLISKPLAWNSLDTAAYTGKHWTTKNLLELKNAQRVTIDGNRFENNWVDAQTGFAIVLTPRGDQSGGPWVAVRDVTFTHNVVVHSTQGINILGTDNYSKTQVTENILVQNNLFDDVAARSKLWGDTGGSPRLFQLIPGLGGGTKGVTIDHNTITAAGTIVIADGTHTGFVFTNNISPHGDYGVFIVGKGEGTAAMGWGLPGYKFQGNVIVGANSSLYPADNSCPSSWQAVGFVDFAGGNYQLAASSPYKGKGTNGTDLGADIAALKTAGILKGTVTPTSTSASALVIAGFPSSSAAGAATTFTVTATDAYGNTATGYSGTVHFSSSDSRAVLPGDYTFSAADKGVHTFSATLKTAGTRSLTITDSATTSITDTQAVITINPGPAGALSVSGFPSSITAGTAASFTVTATDAYGNTASGYRGTVDFSSSDSRAVLPGRYTFVATDNGVHTFSATLKTAGTRSLTAVDTTTSTLQGTEAAITVSAAPNVSYHGGPLLQHVQVESVYAGLAWSSDTNLQQQISQVDGFLQYFASSPYMDVLKQYKVGYGSFVDHDVVAQDPAGGKTIDDGRIRALLSSEISAHHIGAPTPDRLYVLFTAPGVTVTVDGKSSARDFAGYHSAFTNSTGVPVYYAVVPYPTGKISTQQLSAFQQDTIVLSHEVSEAVTDPDTRTGWFDTQRGEISDLALGQFGNLHGYVVQGVWSQADGKVVTPTDTSATTLQVSATQVQTTAGQAFTGFVATITGADAKATTADFTATIDWGDGSSSGGTITVDSKGGFDVNGTNTYRRAGTYTITVTVHDQSSAVVGKASSKADVLPGSKVDAKGTVIWATAGKEFSGPVAAFSDSSTTAAAGNFTVTIDWGDGTTSVGTVTKATKGPFVVNGTHTYPNAHQAWTGHSFGGIHAYGNEFFVIAVTIHDNPANATAMAFSLAQVVITSSNTTAQFQTIQTTSDQQSSNAVARFAELRANTNTTSGQTPITVNGATGFLPSVTTGATRTTTVTAAASQHIQAATSSAHVGAVAEYGLPTGLVGDSAPAQVFFTTASRTEDTKTVLEQTLPQLNGALPEQPGVTVGSKQAPASVFGMPLEQDLTDSGASFWLD